LNVGREFADLVEKDRTAMCQLESPEMSLDGPGERTFLMTEQVRGNEVAGDGRAVHGHEAS